MLTGGRERGWGHRAGPSAGRGLLRRSRDDRGSALMLMPAAVLVLFLLASLAVDSALVWTAQRELANRAAAAANDIAAAAIDENHFYRTGAVALDEREAEAILAEHLASESGGALHSISVTELRVGATTVRLSLSARTDAIFAPAFANLRDTRNVHATAVVEVASRP